MSYQPPRTAGNKAQIRIHGYFYTASMTAYPDLTRTLLNDAFWKLSAKMFPIVDLAVLDIERIWGGYWNPIYVTGVVDTSKGTHIPFFIERQNAKKLKELIRLEDPFIVDL